MLRSPRDLGFLLQTRVFTGVAALALVLAFGTAGYVLIEGWSVLDALYMAAITITTVGYREVHPLSRAGQGFTILLLFVGVGTAFYILTAMVAAIIEGDLRQVFGARRMKMTIERLRDHYIVCGYGRVGAEIARELRERKAPLVVIDMEAAAAARARVDGFLVVEGDATTDEKLVEAGIGSCRALIAASDSDAANTYITLTARGLRADAFVVSRISSPAVEAKLRQAGASRVVSPYSIGGRRLALAALQPIIAEFFELGPTNAQDDRIVAEILVDADSRLAGQQLGEALAGCRDVVPLALRHGDGRLSVGPGAATWLALGDRLMVVGDEAELRTLGALAKG